MENQEVAHTQEFTLRKQALTVLVGALLVCSVAVGGGTIKDHIDLQQQRERAFSAPRVLFANTTHGTVVNPKVTWGRSLHPSAEIAVVDDLEVFIVCPQLGESIHLGMLAGSQETPNLFSHSAILVCNRRQDFLLLPDSGRMAENVKRIHPQLSKSLNAGFMFVQRLIEKLPL